MKFSYELSFFRNNVEECEINIEKTDGLEDCRKAMKFIESVEITDGIKIIISKEELKRLVNEYRNSIIEECMSVINKS